MTDGSNSKELLKSIIERIEAREADKQIVADDIKEIYIEAKSAGFDAPALRAIIRERKQDKSKTAELEVIKDMYRHALGMLAETPLGQAAINSAR